MSELFPPEGHEDVGKKVFSVLEEIVKDKVNLGLHKRWTRNYELLRGKHWKNKSNIPLISANLVYRHIQQTVNQLTDNNPTFNLSKVGPGENQEAYDNLQRAATHWWADQEQQDALESSVKNGETYGICIEKVVFNEELEGGLGEVETVIVDPFHFGVYPVKLRDPREIQKADVVMHYYPMTVREARRKWPEFADKIKGDQTIIKELEDGRRDVNAEAGQKPEGMMVSLASVAKEILNWKTGTDAEEEELIIAEAWVRDRTRTTREEVEVMEAVGEEVMEEEITIIEEPKYPGEIRYIVACNGKIVLEDRPNPNVNLDVLPPEEAKKTYLFDKYPFCAVNSIRDTSSMWGQSDIEQLEVLNIELDKALSQVVLEKDRSARKKYINPKNSGIPNDDFVNYVSILNPINEKIAASIRVLDHPQSPVDIYAAITLFKDLFFLVSATFEVDQAQMGSNQLAYKSIAALIERVATMMRGKIRAYGRLVRERGRMYLSHVQNFYTENRWINYEDEQGIQTSGEINGLQMLVPAKLTVVTGSTLPTSKVQQREESLALFQMGAIDRQELLSSLEWSGRAEVIKRMNAGPIGAALENLGKIGMPQEILQFLGQIMSMDEKELEKGLKEGQIPPFQAIMQQLLQQAQGQKQQTPPLEQAEFEVKYADAQVKQATARKVMAETEKVVAETQLVVAQIESERVEQQVKIKGVEFDEKKITMDQARTVADISKGAKEANAKKLPRPKVTQPIPGAPMTPAPPPPIVPDATAKPAGYNESGAASNNVME